VHPDAEDIVIELPPITQNDYTTCTYEYRLQVLDGMEYIDLPPTNPLNSLVTYERTSPELKSPDIARIKPMSLEQFVTEFVPEARKFTMTGGGLKLKFDLYDLENGLTRDSANMELRLNYEDCKGLVARPLPLPEDQRVYFEPTDTFAPVKVTFPEAVMFLPKGDPSREEG
jgi:hypothetical protein